MRDIKFRAREIDGGNWAYGFVYRHDPPLQCFAGESKEQPSFAIIKTGFADWNMPRPIDQVEVDGKTLGEFTGLKDKNGKDVYEGDIVDCDDQHRIVKYGSQNAGFYMAHKRGMINFRKEFIECGQSQSDGPIHCDTCEVIGNIYENPELLPTK